jgi:hypothetical protein
MCGGGGGGEQKRLVEEQNSILEQQRQDQLNFYNEQIGQAEALEAERRRRAESAIAAVNSAFSNVDSMATKFGDATFDLNRVQLDQDKSRSGLDLKFALARAGLGGGSVDVDKGAELVDRYNTGLTQSRSYASSLADQFRQAQEALRSNLLATAATGQVGPSFFGGVLQNRSTPQPSYLPGLGDIFSGLSEQIGQAALLYGQGRGGGFRIPGFNEFQSYIPGSPGSRVTGREVSY